MEEESDTVLVARARAGEVAALESLARRYLRAAYAVALAVVRNTADAEDLAQEVLMGALQRLEQCRDPARFAPWVLQSVRNRALNQVQQGKLRAALLEGAVRGEAVEADATRVLLRRRLLAALEHLNPTQREVVLLHDLEAWTHGEIARALDISEVMSRQHLFVARRVLREHLKDEFNKEPGHG
ncbi:RNA polymerase sigma factor [Myxococcaceae bacterium GXIMD 01537]